MRYFVINKNGEIICNRGGYKTRKYAEDGRGGLSSPLLYEACNNTRSLGIPPGQEFAEHVHSYIRENSEIIEVSEMSLKCSDGRCIVQAL
jgi:hypothetical protein